MDVAECNNELAELPTKPVLLLWLKKKLLLLPLKNTPVLLLPLKNVPVTLLIGADDEDDDKVPLVGNVPVEEVELAVIAEEEKLPIGTEADDDEDEDV